MAQNIYNMVQYNRTSEQTEEEPPAPVAKKAEPKAEAKKEAGKGKKAEPKKEESAEEEAG